MYLVSIYEGNSPVNFQTVSSLNDLYRGMSQGLDINKFNSMSNFNLFVCQVDIPEFKDEGGTIDYWQPFSENLADSVYCYMADNLEQYFDIVKSIDEFREKVKNYQLDK